MKKIFALLILLAVAATVLVSCKGEASVTQSINDMFQNIEMNYLPGGKKPLKAMEKDSKDIAMLLHFLYPAYGLNNLVFEYEGTFTVNNEESLVLNAYIKSGNEYLLIAKGAKAATGEASFHHFDVAKGIWDIIPLEEGVWAPKDTSLVFGDLLDASLYNPISKYSVRHPYTNEGITFNYEDGTVNIDNENYKILLKTLEPSEKKGEELAKELVSLLPQYMPLTDTEYIKIGDNAKIKNSECMQIYYSGKINEKDIEAGVIYCVEKNGKLYCFTAAVANGTGNNFGVAIDILNSIYIDE